MDRKGEKLVNEVLKGTQVAIKYPLRRDVDVRFVDLVAPSHELMQVGEERLRDAGLMGRGSIDEAIEIGGNPYFITVGFQKPSDHHPEYRVELEDYASTTPHPDPEDDGYSSD